MQDVLGSKWVFHVVRALAESKRGFNDLKRELQGVSAKTLSERLRELRCLGFVEKEVHATSSPPTTYRLTDPGEELGRRGVAGRGVPGRRLSGLARGPARVRVHV